MSANSDSSLSDSDYYDVDNASYYNETEYFSDAEDLQKVLQKKDVAIRFDIQDSPKTKTERFKCIESNIDESHEDLSNFRNKVDNDDSATLKGDLLYSKNDRASLLMDNTSSTFDSDEMAHKNNTYTVQFEKNIEEVDINRKFTSKTLNKIRRLLVDETHSSGDEEFYIGDLLNVIESELMNLPKEKKTSAKKPQCNIGTNPRKPKQKKLKVLSRYAIRSMALKRDHHLKNMEVLASSISKEFIGLDDMIEYFRQVNADFDAEFNQPNTPLGEPNLASERMDDVFVKFKDRIAALQDRYKEVKHCLSLYVKSDKTLKDDLLRNVNKYFVNSRIGEVLSVQYGEILEAFQKSNRFHCEF